LLIQLIENAKPGTVMSK